MPFEEFDKKAKEAASHHHPAYDEKAWGKMEHLLDKHLPQQTEKRKRILWFLLLLAGLGTAGLLLTRPWQDKRPLSALEKRVTQNPVAGTGDPVRETANEPMTGKGQRLPVDGKQPALPVQQPGTGMNNAMEPATGSLYKTTGGERNKNFTAPRRTDKDRPGTDEPRNKDVSLDLDITAGTTGEKPVTHAPGLPGAAERDKPESMDVKPQVPAASAPVLSADTKEVKNRSGEQTAATPAKKAGKRGANTFFLGITTAPDVSFTAKGKPGTTQFITGIGFGFTIRDRITIRTGIYSGRKIYRATPEAYHAPAVFYTYYPYLERVRANCRVTEIPLNLSYQFNRSNRQQWFAGAGISSLLMNEEKYSYTYKRTPTGTLLQRSWSVANENKHFFSILTLSAGYQRTLSTRFSFTAEPYLKIPLTGVGYGNVKLYSSGIAFTLGVKPFVAPARKSFSKN